MERRKQVNDSLRSRGNIVVIFLIRLCAINSLEKHPLSTRPSVVELAFSPFTNGMALI